MKKVFIILLSLLSSSAYAVDSYYGSVQIGRSDVSNSSITSQLGNGVEANGTVSYASKLHGGLAFGRQIDKMRYEIEYQYGRLGVDSASLGAVSKSVSTNGHYEALMLNAYYSHDFSEKVTGFVGGGIGWSKKEIPSVGILTHCNCVAESSGDGTAYQAKIGFDYKIKEDQSVGVQLTTLKLPKATSSTTNYSNENINILGITYKKLF